MISDIKLLIGHTTGLLKVLIRLRYISQRSCSHPETAMVKVVGASLWTVAFALACGLQSLVRAAPSATTSSIPYLQFQSDVIVDGSLRYVKNSGVCETTPGVEQMSGYIEIGTNMSTVRVASSLCCNTG